ncbi:MAG TPA: iron-sulfur cluster repair di-iron protein [Terriglobales bacterium]
MGAIAEKTVREIAVESPAATRVFEKFGIDYCCGGSKPFEEACAKAGVGVEEVLDSIEIEEETARAARQVHDWQNAPLSSLVAHIKNTHHKYTREEVGRLSALLEKVCAVHGKNHSELYKVQTIFGGLAQELTMHMMKEEMVLFPYIVRMEEAVIQNEPVLPAPFGTVQNPVTMMEHEHDSAGNALCAIRKATSEFVTPADACVSYQTLYQALEAFEADLHQHIHLENNILFPRAVAMERSR